MNFRQTTIATTLFMCLAVTALGQGTVPENSASAAPQPQPKNLQILFTDHLLGYYRIPDAQAEDFQALCPEAAPGTPAYELLPIHKGNNTILVGMGNNFAVEFGSRTYQDTRGAHAKSRDPGTKFSLDKIGDNVSCFLSRAGYDALAPGKGDFYFGAERLRLLAQQLASVPKSDEQGPVHMLAANLAVKTDYWQKPKDIPDSQKKLNFETDLPDGIDSLDIADSDTILPYLKRIRFRLRQNKKEAGRDESETDFQPYLCQAKPSDPDALDLKNCSASKTGLVKLVKPKNDNDKDDTVTYEFPQALSSGNNYGLCDQVSHAGKTNKKKQEQFGKSKSGPHCLRFFVAEPYFLSAACTEGSCSYDLPYVYIPEKNVVIFGVVDPDLRSYVGRDNMSWKNSKDPNEYKTEVTVLDPGRSLQQAVQSFCNSQQNDVDCTAISKVLLAEMGRDQAEELATHTGFDIVIAGGADYAHATSNQCIHLDPDPEGRASDRENPFRAVVVVPWSGYDYSREKKDHPVAVQEKSQQANDNKRHLVNPLRQLEFNDEATGKRVVRLSREHLRMRYEEPDDLNDQYDRIAREYLDRRGYKKVCKKTDDPAKECQIDKPFQTATLEIMRASTDADVVLVQKRDFYYGPFNMRTKPDSKDTNSLAKSAGEGFDRILWKGDIVQVITVKGSTLKKVLDESDQFDQLDKQPIKLTRERGRGLLTFGLEKTDDDNYLVDGKLLDPDRLYTAATTSHIMAGDTGYPELNDQEVVDRKLPTPPPAGTSPRERGESRRISELVCNWMVPGQPNSCGESLTTLFAKGGGQPSKLAPTTAEELRAWALNSWHAPKLEQEGQPPENTAENRPTWRLSLSELSADLNRARNNLSEVERVNKLSGVSDPGAGAAKSHSINFTTTGEWVRSGESVDDFIRGHVEYDVTSTANTTQVGPKNIVVPTLPVLSRSKNQVVVDAGFFLHPVHPHKSDPRWGFVLQPFRFDTQLHEEAVQVDAHYDSLGNLDRKAFKVPLERTRLFLSRVGVRYENAKSHFELGYEGGWETNALDRLTFDSSACDLTAAQSLEQCLTNQGASIDPATIQQIRETRRRHGMYADVDWTLPLFWKWKLVTKDQGEWFGPSHNDNSTDTLYRNDWTTNLSIPIFSNLSVGPGLELFSYENKVGHTHLLRVSPMMKINYTFDKYSGGKWKKSLAYKPGGGGDE